jgi:ribulose-phosphate 3-epimerase
VTSSVLDRIRNATPAILPSLLMCDFGDLRGEVDRLEKCGIEVLHLDVMDGHFVPNLTYGMPIVEGLRRHTNMPLDVHLMISDPLKYAPAMVDAGADMLTFHIEAATSKPASQIAKSIADLGVPVGIALNPATPVEAVIPLLDHVDMVLVMSVNAGFGGQSFDPSSLDKLATLKRLKPDLLLEIDGGIDTKTIGLARQAGCDLFVVGSAIFRKDDYGHAIDDLTAAMNQEART